MTSLLYADDTVLMSESPEELQRELNNFHEYCTTWKLKVNVEKHSHIMFRRWKTPEQFIFLI